MLLVFFIRVFAGVWFALLLLTVFVLCVGGLMFAFIILGFKLGVWNFYLCLVGWAVCGRYFGDTG